MHSTGEYDRVTKGDTGSLDYSSSWFEVYGVGYVFGLRFGVGIGSLGSGV